MKTNFNEYYKACMYTIIGLMIVFSSYTIIINTHHYKSLKEKVLVSEIDVNYKKFINNVIKYEEILNKNKKINNNDQRYLTNTLTNLKKGGLYRLIPNNKLEYHDLYKLNNYFIDVLINDSWINNLKKIDLSKKYDNEINFIISNANYINNLLMKNGVVMYDSIDSHKIVNDYQLILNNYAMFSDILINIINNLGGLSG